MPKVIVLAGTLFLAGLLLTKTNWGAGAAGGDETAAALLFERDVLPLLTAHCLRCHGLEDLKAGLDLRTMALLQNGGKSGPPLVAGSSRDSLLYRKISERAMPPGDGLKLNDAQIGLIGRWIDAGARSAAPLPSTVEKSTVPAEALDHWAFRPLRRHAAPAVRSAERARTEVDRFIIARLEEEGLSLAPEADRAALFRRAHLDLLGLPPDPDDLDRFLSDDSPDSYERLIDRLLASPAFGERWGRRWLDWAGYADVSGGDNDAGTTKLADGKWRYRDYVVRSLNEDKPFDRFLREQLAGDELVDWRSAAQLTPEIQDLLVATGFLRSSADDTDENELNTADIRHGVLARTVEVVSSNLLALTVNCARCHDHKYDPIPQRDYYRLLAVFTPAFNPQSWRQPKDRALADISLAERKAGEAENAVLQKRIEELKAAKAAGSEPEIARLEAAKRRWGTLQAVYDVGPPPATYLLRRGDHHAPAAEVEPGLLTALTPGGEAPLPNPKPAGATSGRRLALARLLTERGSPAAALAARVLANRLWQELFGAGIVETSDNFGRSGARPSHPQLLEWLASELEDGGWRLKPFLRLVMTSSVYRQSSSAAGLGPASPGGARTSGSPDPEDRLLWRMRLKRLEAEAVRDSILAASGALDRTLGGPPVPIQAQPDGSVVVPDGGPAAVPLGGSRGESRATGRFRRSLYLLARRNYHLSFLSTFDQPAMSTNCTRRVPSAVVSQPLAMLNDRLVLEEADRFAARVVLEAGPCGEGRPGREAGHCREAGACREAWAERAFRIALSRPPTPAEARWCGELLERVAASLISEGRPPEEAERLALAQLCHTLYNTSEFLYAP